MSDQQALSSPDVYNRVRAILREARHSALTAVNAAMVQAYWNVGREIVEEEQRGKERAEYGDRLLETLSVRLTAEFGQGYTTTNLKYMRLVYLAFPNRHALRDELSWTHYRLLSRVTRLEARQFYLQEAIASRWSTRELDRQMNEPNRFLPPAINCICPPKRNCAANFSVSARRCLWLCRTHEKQAKTEPIRGR